MKCRTPVILTRDKGAGLSRPRSCWSLARTRVMVNHRCQLGWATDALIAGTAWFLSVPVRAPPEEISICIGSLSGDGCVTQPAGGPTRTETQSRTYCRPCHSQASGLRQGLRPSAPMVLLGSLDLDRITPLAFLGLQFADGRSWDLSASQELCEPILGINLFCLSVYLPIHPSYWFCFSAEP